jgi:tetratricopeptide (TPR) repeat protein
MTIQRLLDALTDGGSVDWDEAEQQAPDEDSRRTIRELRVVAGIFDAHQAEGRHRSDAIPTPFRWGPLRVDEFIARGAHGDVYRAWDPRLERHVALKLLHRDVLRTAADQAPIAEGRLLARVRHPNVVTVYGADRIEGRAGVWMEFVAGPTVREQIDASGPLSPDKAAGIACAICSGLAALHDAGLIHRDVKAQNVVQDISGRTILMDLGAGQEDDDASERVEGTPVYLAPELLKGGRATVASDVYAIGVLLYYMLTSRYPVEGRSIDTLRQYYESKASGSTRVRPGADLPLGLARVTARALSTNPADRFPSAMDLKAAIEVAQSRPVRRLAFAAMVLVGAIALGGIGVASWQRIVAKPIQFQARDAVLVATFENRTGESVLDGTIDYAFQRELTTTPYITVVSRDRVNDALRLMRRPLTTPLDIPTAREVATRDGEIRAIVTGRVDRVGTTYSLAAEILNPASGVAVATFGENVSGENDLLGAVRREALTVRHALGEQREDPASSRRTLAKVATPSLRALQLYSQAASQWPMNNMALAETYLGQALTIDPEFASAHLLLAWAVRNSNRSPSEYMPHAEEALRLSGTATQAEQDFIVGSVHDFRSLVVRDEAEQRKEARLALAAYQALEAEQPAHQWVGNNLRLIYERLGMTGEALQLVNRTADLRPLDFGVNVRATMISFSLGDKANAARYYSQAMKAPHDHANPGPLTQIAFYPAYAAWADGDVKEAARVVESVVSTIPSLNRDDVRQWFGRAAVLALLSLGQTHRAEEIAQRITDTNIRRASTIVALDARQDRERLRQVLLTLEPEGSKNDWFAVTGSAFVAAGLLHQTHERLRRSGSENPLILMIESKLALAEGRYKDAVTAGKRYLSRTPTVGELYQLQTAETVASALHQLGNSTDAITLLERYTARREESLTGLAQRGDNWIEGRLQLAGLYRDAGRLSEAVRVEAEVTRMLAVADSDHPLVLELKRRGSIRN